MGNYEQFRAQLLLQVKLFKLTGDYKSLEKALKLVSKVAANSQLDDQFFLVISGWFRKGAFSRIPIKKLWSRNHFPRFKFRRLSRSDVRAKFPFLFLRFGFEISFSISKTPNFHDFWPLPSCCELDRWANFTNRDLCESFNKLFASPYTFRYDEVQSISCSCGAVGYVENFYIQNSRKPVSTWFEDILRQEPQSMLFLLKHSKSQFVLDQALKIWESFPYPQSYRDLFALLSQGSKMHPASSLKLLDVERTFVLSSSTTKVQIPKVNSTGSSVSFGPSPAETYKQQTGPSSFLFNAEVQLGGCVIQGNSLITLEWAADSSRDFVSGNWKYIFGNSRYPEVALVDVLKDSGLRIEEAILISGRNDANWYHWMCEYLPRALSFDHVSPEVPFLISDQVPKQGVEALKAISDRNIRVVPYFERTKINKLHVAPPVIQVLDEFGLSAKESIAIDETALKKMIRKIKPSHSQGHRRVFCYRKSTHRNLVNETECALVASDLGFEVISIDGLSWQEQVELYSSVQVMVSAGGAVMSNYLLMPDNSKAISIVSNPLVDFTLPALLADLSNIKFQYLIGQPMKSINHFESRSDYIHQDFKIDISELRQELITIISELDNVMNEVDR